MYNVKHGSESGISIAEEFRNNGIQFYLDN